MTLSFGGSKARSGNDAPGPSVAEGVMERVAHSIERERSEGPPRETERE